VINPGLVEGSGWVPAPTPFLQEIIIDASSHAGRIQAIIDQLRIVSAQAAPPHSGDASAHPPLRPAAPVPAALEQRLLQLSPRECCVLYLLGAGLRIGEVAIALKRSPKTVSTQKRSVMRKLGVESDFELHLLLARLAVSAPCPVSEIQNSDGDRTS
jgi:DNA-binding NarL/FixJ family response regulator